MQGGQKYTGDMVRDNKFRLAHEIMECGQIVRYWYEGYNDRNCSYATVLEYNAFHTVKGSLFNSIGTENLSMLATVATSMIN